MTQKIDMQKATVTTWHRKNQSSIRITAPDGNSVVLNFKTQETLDAFADKVLDLLEALDDDPYDETDNE